MQTSSFRVLIVDDDECDRFLIANAFGAALRGEGKVLSVDGGEQAIRYLCGQGIYSDRETYPFPNLIMLDLKMPVVDGLAVLEFLGRNPAWSVIPRIVFSSSSDPDDIKKAYLVGATVYHPKPVGADEMKTTIASVVGYWKGSVLPPVDQNGRLLITDSRGKLGERIPQPRGGAEMERD